MNSSRLFGRIFFFSLSSKWEWKKCDKQRNQITIDKWIFTQEFRSSADKNRKPPKKLSMAESYPDFSLYDSRPVLFFLLFTFVYITMVVGIENVWYSHAAVARLLPLQHRAVMRFGSNVVICFAWELLRLCVCVYLFRCVCVRRSLSTTTPTTTTENNTK